VVVTSTIIHSITLFLLARERKSTVKISNPNGTTTELSVVDSKTLNEFTDSVKHTFKRQGGEF
jgi:hypothetical protein